MRALSRSFAIEIRISTVVDNVLLAPVQVPLGFVLRGSNEKGDAHSATSLDDKAPLLEVL